MKDELGFEPLTMLTNDEALDYLAEIVGDGVAPYSLITEQGQNRMREVIRATGRLRQKAKR